MKMTKEAPRVLHVLMNGHVVSIKNKLNNLNNVYAKAGHVDLGPESTILRKDLWKDTSKEARNLFVTIVNYPEEIYKHINGNGNDEEKNKQKISKQKLIIYVRKKHKCSRTKAKLIIKETVVFALDSLATRKTYCKIKSNDLNLLL
uniref:Uncharacterized protein n=1 Tax=viral metagenome TaxID=1070528 RepID=A0A6M3L9D4_9ZZZZ